MGSRKRLKSVSDILDEDYSRDLEQLRSEYIARVRDADSRRDWLIEHNYLRVSDLAVVAGVAIQTIRRWQRAAGLAPRSRNRMAAAARPRGLARPQQNYDVPEDWRDQSNPWLRQMHDSGQSVVSLSKMVGLSRPRVAVYLRRHGARIRTPAQALRSKNPCCTRKWLQKHFVDMRLPILKCARLAGVHYSTMAGWLVLFKFRSRPNSEHGTARGDVDNETG